MTSKKLLKVGAMAGIIFSIFAVLVSDMHTIPDSVLTLAQRNGNSIVVPDGIEFPYWVTVVAASPI